MDPVSELLAVVDETVLEEAGAVRYVLAAVVVTRDAATRAVLAGVVNEPGRARPFHWHREGPLTRQRMVKALIETGAVAHAVIDHPTKPRQQGAARARTLAKLLGLVRRDEPSELLIESRGPVQDRQDRVVILDWLAESGPGWVPTYGWCDKAEAYSWFADAVCGAIRLLLDRTHPEYFQALFEGRVLGEPLYLSHQGLHVRKSRLPS
ncbi:MAG: hypothetical protein ACRDX8_00875 [Acidimicrobiales bacterium]